MFPLLRLLQPARWLWEEWVPAGWSLRPALSGRFVAYRNWLLLSVVIVAEEFCYLREVAQLLPVRLPGGRDCLLAYRGVWHGREEPRAAHAMCCALQQSCLAVCKSPFSCMHGDNVMHGVSTHALAPAFDLCLNLFCSLTSLLVGGCLSRINQPDWSAGTGRACLHQGARFCGQGLLQTAVTQCFTHNVML